MYKNKRPTLAIVGRPNVGKSALFNRIAKKRIAIVDEEEGVTRDRLVADVEACDFKFRLIDTGGIDPYSSDKFKNEITAQAHIAIEEADTIVMVVDGRIGVTALDEELARFLLRSQKPLTLAVSKMDTFEHDHLIHKFHKLGIKNIVGVSSTHNINIDTLLETAWEGFKFPEAEEYSSAVKIAIVGKPNVGKSTLINTLLDESRLVVSPIPGTTRDTIDLPLTFQGKEYVLMDTAGVRRKRAEKSTVEKFAYLRTLDAIERADVAVLMLDATDGIKEMDKRLLKDIEEAGRGCVIVFNKWDMIKGYRMEHCLTALHELSPFLKHVPMLFISAKNNRNLDKIFPEIDKVVEARGKRLTTGELNKFLERAMQLNHPPSIQGKRLRIYYITQIAVSPPRFILFVNVPKLMAPSYRKYLINQFREHFGFPGVPLVFYLRGKKKMDRTKLKTPKPIYNVEDVPDVDEEGEEIEAFEEDDFDEAEVDASYF
jgi:GTP-binding protein